MPQSWIAPQQNSLLDTFAQVEQLKNYRATNALAEAKAAELPYERGREAALNAAKIKQTEAQTGKAESETRKADADFAIKMAEFVGRDPSNEEAVLGAFKFGAERFPALAPIGAKLETLRGTPGFAQTASQFAMAAKDKAAADLNVTKENRAERNTQSQIAYRDSMLGKPMVMQTPGGAFTYDPSNPQEVTRMDTGPSQAELAAEKEVTRQYERANPVPAPMSAKDRTMSKLKMTNIRLAKQQLAAVRDAYEKMGLACQYNPASESGRLFERTVDALRSTISGLTRTPGVGAMSDYETRLDQAKMPTRLDYPGVTEQQIQSLDDMVNTLEAGYSDLTGPPPQQAPNTPRAPVTMVPPVMEPGADPGGTREQFIEEARKRGLVP